MDMNISDASTGSFWGEQTSDYAGRAISIAGDVNGDGLDDILIGSTYNDDGGMGAGQTYLIFGKASDWMMDVNLSDVDASFLGEESDDGSGVSVSGAGDVNGDGYDDILIAADFSKYGGNTVGEVYLVMGKSSGWSMDTDLGSSDASFVGEQDMDLTGRSISGAGDVNDDGYDDFVIGAKNNDAGGDMAGQTYLILGKASGWGMHTPLSSVDASFIGEDSNDQAGDCVSRAGDVNGDGYDDLLIGAQWCDAGGSTRGQTYLILGKASGWEMDADLSDADASFIGEEDSTYTGVSVSGGGDINGDGYDDILIGSDYSNTGGSHAGETFIIFGKASGWAMDTSLSTKDASFVGEEVDDYAGWDISGLEDINGDGFDDILIGAKGNDAAGTDSGQSYLVLGKASGWTTNADLSTAYASFIGERAGDESGFSISGGGDVNGDGLGDILIGAHSNDENGIVSGQIYLISSIGVSDPLEVYSIVVKNDLGNVAGAADILDVLQVEVTGLDSNITHISRARVNITFSESGKVLTISLVETGINTGVYKGNFVVPAYSEYFEKMRFSAYVDNSKYQDVTVDYPYRPTSITSIGLFKDALYTKSCYKADFLDTVYLEVRGADANALKIDKAFAKVTSDKNGTMDDLLIMIETEKNTGVYRGTMGIPETMAYFENITIESVEDRMKKASFMVHTPVQIRTLDDATRAVEDSEYDVEFYNFGYNPVTWEMSTIATWIDLNSTSRRVRGIASNREVGPWEVMLTIRDQEGHKDTYDFTVSVENSAPIILTQDVLTATENQDYHVDYGSSDDGQGTVVWFMDTNTDWLSLDRDTGVISGRPMNDDVGISWVKVTVDDGNGGRDWTMYNLTVIDVNQRPVIVTEDIFSVEQDTPFRRDYEVSDPDTGDTHIWVLVTEAQWLTIESDTGVLKGTPGPQDVGSFEVNVTVLDLGGLWDSHNFELIVTDVKDKPTWVDIPSAEVEMINGEQFRFDANATDNDAGDVVVYSVQTDPVSEMTMNPNTGVILWTASMQVFTQGDNTMTVILKASDGELFSIYAFNIKVVPTGSPEVSLLGPDDEQRVSSRFVLLTWIGTDPEDEALTYDVYLSETESVVMGRVEESLLVNEHSASEYNVTGLTPGKLYYWTVIPFDGGSHGTCVDGILSFKVNDPPKIEEFTDLNAFTGKEFKIKVKGSDADTEDSGNLKYSLTRYPAGMTIDEETGTILWKPTEEQMGDRSVKVELTDGIDTTVYEFSVNVMRSESEGFPMWIFGLIAVLIVIGLGVVLFIIIRRKKREDEDNVVDETDEVMADIEHHQKSEEAMYAKAAPVVESSVPLSMEEAHRMDGRDRPKTYEDMYGKPVKGMTASDLKRELSQITDELENAEIDEE